LVTRSLIAALDRAQSPRTVGLIVRGLELWTGQTTEQISGTKGLSIDGMDLSGGADWYQHNGYYQIARALGGYSNYSGKRVTADTALESAAVYACTKILGEDLGRLPFFLYQRTGQDSVEKAYGHPLFPILHDMPNPDMNAQAFVECLTARAFLCREGFARIDRASDGSVLYLWPLTGTMTRVPNQYGRPVFVYKDGNAAEKTYAAGQIFNLPGFSLDGSSGDDILQRARHVLGLTLATQEYPARFFANDATPGIILKRPTGTPALDDLKVAAIKDKWRAWHQGASRAHEPAILQDGMDAMRLDPDHQKLQMMEARKFQVIEVCRIARMSPHMLADLDRATFSNIEQLYSQHLTLTLGPWLKRWRQSTYRCLLSPAERASYFAEHSVEDFQRGLFQDQAAGFAQLLEKGVYSINEVRRWFNMNPVEGGDGHYIQLNMQAVADAATGAVVDQGTKLIPTKKPPATGAGVN
jgi:HK97 family phage portal protein